MKFDQILVWCMTNISNMFLANAGDWKLVPGPFMLLLKWRQWDFAIFNSWHLPFLYVPDLPCQKNETLESCHNSLLSNSSRWLNWKGPGT